MYEVFLSRRVTEVGEWEKFLRRLVRDHRVAEKFVITFRSDQAVLRIFIESPRELPHFLVGADGFVINKTREKPENYAARSVKPLILKDGETIATLAEKFKARDRELKEVKISVRRLARNYSFAASVVVENENGAKEQRKILGATTGLLNLDLRKKFLLQKPEKFLNAAKTLNLMTTEAAGAVLKMNAYPYLNGEHYLNLKNYDFYKHTAVFGATGSGKTKFLCQMISEIAEKYGENYHMLVLDPHDTMRYEIGGLEGAKVYDFATRERGLSLFHQSAENIVSDVDMTLSLIKSLMKGSWNARLERLLRASLYLLTEKGELSFQNLRRLLVDPTYKNACLAAVGEYLPESLQEFFGQDYNELRTQHYDATFARVLTFIDELQLTPAFYRQAENRLDYELAQNKITLVSLSQTALGEDAAKILAGLMMNQLFLLGMQRKLRQHIILVVDEVAVVENPVLTRFLSEARKYNISVVLAGQYFSQISPELRTAIYANTANYWCFRLNYDDAEMLQKYLEMELASDVQVDYGAEKAETFVNDAEEKAKLLAYLPAREAVVRVSRSGVLLPAVMGRSLDFAGVAEEGMVKPSDVAVAVEGAKAGLNLAEKLRSSAHLSARSSVVKANIFDLMREQSTSRRKVNG